MPMQWKEAHMPLATGLMTKADPRALDPPQMPVCRNAEFDLLGGMQPRKPYRVMSDKDQDGTTLTDLRRLAVYNDELLLYTKDSVYTYSEADQRWASRGTYRAPIVNERSVFTSTEEQVKCDRAELDGVIVYAWHDSGADLVRVAARDKESGATLLAPYALDAATDFPRLVALGTKILLFAEQGTNLLRVKAIDPHDLSTSVATSWTSVSGVFNGSGTYDAVKYDDDTALVVVQHTTTTNHVVYQVEEDLTIPDSDVWVRTCDGPIAIAVAPNKEYAIIRSNGTTIEADLYDTLMGTATDTGVALGTASGTPVNQLAAAFSTTDQGSSLYRCYVFWTAEAGTLTNFHSEYNYVDTDANTGTETLLAYRVAVASRAFDYDGTVHVWTAFAQQTTTNTVQLQNSYLLYDSSTNIVAKACTSVGSGHRQSNGLLPNVQALDDETFACCLGERRLIAFGSSEKGYGARGPRDCVVTFDSDDARRGVQLGKTLYIPGGQIMQYDSRNLVEVGFHVFPYNISVVDPGTGGNIEAGTYTYLPAARWDNAQSERERSTSATYFDVAIAASRDASISSSPVHQTNKRATQGNLAIEYYRTQKNAGFGLPLYRVTADDPTATGDNAYEENDVTSALFSTYTDSYADSTLITKEQWPESAARLENVAPPPATIAAAGQSRVFLAGIGNEPHTVQYSQLRGDGEIAAFNDALKVALPTAGGPITALALLDEALVVFKRAATYLLPGVGFDNTGGGQNYGPERRIATDVGCVSPDAVAQVPDGLIFKSAKGWYILNRGFSLTYIGDQVAAFDDEDVVAIDVLESQHHVRVTLKNSAIICYDYVRQQWSEWTVANALSAAVWNGKHVVVCSDDRVREQQADFVDATEEYGLDIELGPFHPGELNGFARLRGVTVLGEYRGPHKLRARFAYDADRDDDNDTIFDEVATWDPDASAAGETLRVEFRPGRQKATSYTVRITAVHENETAGNGEGGLVPANDRPPVGEAVRLTGLTLQYGVERGVARTAKAQKQGGM